MAIPGSCQEWPPHLSPLPRSLGSPLLPPPSHPTPATVMLSHSAGAAPSPPASPRSRNGCAVTASPPAAPKSSSPCARALCCMPISLRHLSWSSVLVHSQLVSAPAQCDAEPVWPSLPAAHAAPRAPMPHRTHCRAVCCTVRHLESGSDTPRRRRCCPLTCPCLLTGTQPSVSVLPSAVRKASVTLRRARCVPSYFNISEVSHARVSRVSVQCAGGVQAGLSWQLSLLHLAEAIQMLPARRKCAAAINL